MLTEFGPALELLLVLISFLSGIGITAIGPGGIFVTIALYTLTGLSAGQVAGTASATFVATGVLGTFIYFRSGELREPTALRISALLGATSIPGALLGAWLNSVLSARLFGFLLGLLVVIVGGVILHQEWRGLRVRMVARADTAAGRAALLALGFGIGVAGGLLGVGGPVLAVPALVVLGAPLLLAVAVAQLQSVLLAAFATIGYLLQGAVLWPLALLIVVPQLAGAVIGWGIAHRIDPGRLRLALGLVLLVVGPYIALA